jgi:hypothetical protein
VSLPIQLVIPVIINPKGSTLLRPYYLGYISCVANTRQTIICYLLTRILTIQPVLARQLKVLLVLA